MFKTGTTLAGSLSGALSLNYKGESAKKAKPASNGKQYPQVMAFDARPVIMDSYDDVDEYIRYRWLIGGRNLMSKTLRLANVLPGDDLYQLGKKNNVDLLCQLVEENRLQDQYHAAMREFTLFIPSELTHAGRFEEVHPRDGIDGIDELCERLRALRARSG